MNKNTVTYEESLTIDSIKNLPKTFLQDEICYKSLMMSKENAEKHLEEINAQLDRLGMKKFFIVIEDNRDSNKEFVISGVTFGQAIMDYLGSFLNRKRPEKCVFYACLSKGNWEKYVLFAEQEVCKMAKICRMYEEQIMEIVWEGKL